MNVAPVLACLTAAALVVGAAGATAVAPAPKPATADEVARLVRDLTTAQEATVEHVVTRLQRVRFFTRRPCARLVEVAHFEAHPGAEWIASLVGTLELARLDSLANLPRRLCWADTTRLDRLRLIIGKGNHAVTAYPRFSDLSTSWYQGSLYLATPIEPHVAGLRELLQQALPRDSLLADMPACIPAPDTLLEDEDLMPGSNPPPDELPESAGKTAPIYPEMARMSDIEGTVMIEALVTRDGRVARTLIASSIRELDEEAVRAVEQWTFKPARTRGRPVAVWVALPVNFHLH